MHNMCISCSKPSPCRAQRGTPQERARTPAPAWCGPRAGAGGASHEHIARARRGFGHVPRIDAVAAGSFRAKDPPAIRGTGYVVLALEAALWAFAKSRTFEEGALLAVNLGDDADTTGAIYGQLAGAHYGVEAIPAHWRVRLALRERIETLADGLLALAETGRSATP